MLKDVAFDDADTTLPCDVSTSHVQQETVSAGGGDQVHLA